MYLGIDFGTCFSSVAVWDKNSHRAITDGVLRDDREGTGMPTVMAIDPHDKNKVICGFDCERDPYIPEEKKIRYIKKQIRKHMSSNPMNERPDEKRNDSSFHHARADLVTDFLVELLHNAIFSIQEKDIVPDNKKVEGITITVPSGLGTKGYAGQHKMRATYSESLLKSVELALGRREIRELLTDQWMCSPELTTIAEPVAAAIAFLEQSSQIYSIQARAPKGKILVLDLGGGTCDVTVLGYDLGNDYRHNFEVIDEDGDLELGGNDWTEALFDHVNKKHYGGSIQKGGLDYINKKKELENAKITLSSKETVYLQGDITVSRSEFEDVTQGLCKRVLDLVTGVANRQGGISTFERVVLVGGASRMPQIINGIATLYPAVKDRTGMFDPSKAIASGAVLYLAPLPSPKSNGGGEKKLTVIVKAYASYGVDYCRHDDKTLMVNNIIMKGTAFNNMGYIEGTSDTFQPMENYQEQVGFKIYESNCTDKNAVLDPNVFTYNNMEYTIDVPKDCLKHARKWSLYCKMRLYKNGEIECKFYDCYKKKLNGQHIVTEIPSERIEESDSPDD